MPKHTVDGSNGEDFSKEREHNVPQRAIFSERSPRSPLSSQSPPFSTLSPETNSLDLAIDGVSDTSIEKLCRNICDMQSSDHSPSQRSFLSYGEESRIDSELRFLAGGDYDVVEIKKEVVSEDKGGDTNNVHPAGVKSTSQPLRRRHPLSQLGSEPIQKASLRNKPLKGRPPKGKQGVKGPKKFGAVSAMKNEKSPPIAEDEHGEEGVYLGVYLLKQARGVISSGNSYQNALELALRAMKAFETSVTEKPNLDYVMCLHVVSALYCRLGQYAEAIPLLERSIDIPVIDLGQSHALAKFSGCMQLGDTYAMLGQIENSILFYTAGLEIQRQVLGEKDSRFGETCRFLAEAHVQAIQFDEAEKMCLMALDIHKQNGPSASLEEATDRRLMGLICDSKGDYAGALEHYVLASMSMAANGQIEEIASIDCNIGDAYLSMARYDEAIFAYQKALNMFNSSKGKNHPSVASVFVRLADLYNKIGKFSESRSYCENSLRIYSKPTIAGISPDEIASSLVDISAIYESMNEPDHALELLQKALKVYGNAPGVQSIIAGIEAQMGVLYYILGRYSESYNALKNASLKLREMGEKKSAVLGIVLYQMGLACVQLFSINEAADLFEEAQTILEAESGPYHADTLGVYSNLSGTFDAMGRTGNAIEILEYVVEMREEKLGTANPVVEDEKRRLSELLKEAGMERSTKSKTLETLLVNVEVS